jgi:hypothetical protein
VLARTVALALALAATAAHAADPIPPAGLADLNGPRSLGLSASIGTAAANDGLFVNPAALAARKRYSVESLFLTERRGSGDALTLLGGSVVDSLSSPVTAGFSYQRALKGLNTGNVWHLAMAGPVLERFYAGVTGKWLSVSGADAVSAGTADVGLFWEPVDLLSIGAAGYNLISIGRSGIAPRGVGAGLSVGSDTSLHATADWRADFDRVGKTTNRYAVGAEMLLGAMVPIRAGYIKDDILGTDWWSAGMGIIVKELALELGFRQSTQDSSAREIALSVKLNLTSVPGAQ